MKKFVLPIVLSLALTLVACSNATPGPANEPTRAPTLPPVKSTGTVSSEGRLQPLRSANLSFVIAGEVAEVLVNEGEAVTAGQVIARLRDDALQAAVVRAEAGVAAAKANQAKYLESLPQQIAAARADVQAAQAQVAAANARRSNAAEIAAAEAALAQAQIAQQAAEDAYKAVLDKNQLGPTEERARLTVDVAKRATETAQLRLNQIRRGSLNDQANTAAIEAANARLKAAEINLTQLEAEADGQPNPTYAAAIKQAETALASAQARLAEATLKAPFAGTIAQLNLEAGETAAPGAPVVVLADLSGWLAETDDLTEIKVPGITPGQKVTVQADALPSVQLSGEVTSIGTVFQEKSGDVVYPVKVKLLETDPRLRWGMTVNVTFGQ